MKHRTIEEELAPKRISIPRLIVLVCAVIFGNVYLISHVHVAPLGEVTIERKDDSTFRVIAPGEMFIAFGDVYHYKESTWHNTKAHVKLINGADVTYMITHDWEVVTPESVHYLGSTTEQIDEAVSNSVHQYVSELAAGSDSINIALPNHIDLLGLRINIYGYVVLKADTSITH